MNIIVASTMAMAGLIVLGTTVLFAHLFLWKKEDRAELRRNPQQAFICFFLLAVSATLFAWVVRDGFMPTNHLISLSEARTKALEEEAAVQLKKARERELEVAEKQNQKELPKTPLKNPEDSLALKAFEAQKRARLHTKLGSHEKAVADWEEAMGLWRKENKVGSEFFLAMAAYERAVSLTGAQRWQEAISEFERMAKAGEPFPFDGKPSLRLSEIYESCPDLKFRDKKLAVKYIRLAEEKRAQREEHWNNMNNGWRLNGGRPLEWEFDIPRQ